MPAKAPHQYVDAVDVGERISRRDSDRPGRKSCGIMECERVIRLRKAGVEPVIEHRFRALAGLLARLEHHDERARPLILHRCKPSRRADERGHVRVVAAGVHDTGLDA